MKNFLILLFIGFTFVLNAQILTVGGSIGTPQNFSPWAFGGMIEIKPKAALLSLNFDPSLSFYSGEASFNYPIYFKLILGTNFRVCPTVGYMGRTETSNSKAQHGGTLGLMLEQRVRKKDFVFLKFDFMNEHSSETQPAHFGKSYYENIENNFWFSVGYRTILF